MKFYQELRRLRPSWVLGAAILLVVQIGIVDGMTGREVSFSIFYLLPVVLVGWVCPRWHRLTICLLAGITWLGAELAVQHYSEQWIGYWNALVRMGILIVCSELTAQLSRRNADLEKEIAERIAAEAKLKDLTETLEQKVAERSAAAEVRSVELARSENALRRQTKILQSVLNSMGDGVIVVAATGDILLCNPEARRLLGIDEGDRAIDLWLRRQRKSATQALADDLAHTVRLLNAAARGEVIDGAELSLCSSAHTDRRWMRLASPPLQNEQGNANGAVIVLGDLSMRKSLERQIAEVSEREQRRIGQDLHDGVCQHFVSTSFACNMLAEVLSEKGLQEASQAAHISASIKEGILQARSLARVLHPVQLSIGGLIPALEDLAQSVRKLTNVDCAFKCDQQVCVTDEVTATNLYRIAQEATNNALKHGRASNIQIRLIRRDDWLRLTVADNGVGFASDRKSAKGMGLPIMNSRASLIGASFDVHSVESGTVVTCSLRTQPE